jgi:uncharacterized phage-associated protein
MLDGASNERRAVVLAQQCHMAYLGHWQVFSFRAIPARGDEAGDGAVASAEDVAAYILARHGEPMTAMKLQKLVYYAYAWHLVWDESRLFDEPIQAWANGPVVPGLYGAHRGSLTVDGAMFPGGRPDDLTASERETIDAVLDAYGGKSAHELSELTHREQPWRAARRRAGLGVGDRGEAPILDADMFEFYDGLTAAATE